MACSRSSFAGSSSPRPPGEEIRRITSRTKPRRLESESNSLIAPSPRFRCDDCRRSAHSSGTAIVVPPAGIRAEMPSPGPPIGGPSGPFDSSQPRIDPALRGEADPEGRVWSSPFAAGRSAPGSPRPDHPDALRARRTARSCTAFSRAECRRGNGGGQCSRGCNSAGKLLFPDGIRTGRTGGHPAPAKLGVAPPEALGPARKLPAAEARGAACSCRAPRARVNPTTSVEPSPLRHPMRHADGRRQRRSQFWEVG